MIQKIRLVITAVVLVSIIFLARNGTAWAQRAAPPASGSPSISADLAEDSDAAPQGTVRPPPGSIRITKTGNYSLAGVCVIKVKNLPSGIVLIGQYVSLRNAAPFPRANGQVMSGVCGLTYYQGTSVLPLLPPPGNVSVCFAAIPRPWLTFTNYLLAPSSAGWAALPTTISGGQSCSSGIKTGMYILVAKRNF